MITIDFAKAFAKEWIAAWNSHDLPRILSHYSDDFLIETPMAERLMPGSNGIVKGKEAISAYWTIGLKRIPDLNFELIDVLIGINGLSVYYVNTATQKRSVEIFDFNQEGKVNRSVVYYSE